MTCYSPLKGYRPLSNLDGGRLVFDSNKALNPDHPMPISCGQCTGCRQSRAIDWATRCAHEAQVHSANSFLTLTYTDEALPQNGSVSVRDWQLFMKRVRKRLGSGIRYFGCGEYGENTFRAHYHGLLFGLDLPDKKHHRMANGYPVYKSDLLAELWPHGSHEIGSVTAQSSGYCAQYVQKKVTGKAADDHYLRVSPVDGVAYRVAPEFATMSRRPGIGAEWFNRFSGDVFPSDHVILDGQPRKAPKFYLKLMAEPEAERIKRRRTRLGLRYSFDHSGELFRSAASANEHKTPERLAVRRVIHEERLKRAVRTL